MDEHVGDPFVQQARKAGYRSRAAFKLIELDQRDRLLRPGARVIDLGGAPGSWSQVASARVGSAGLVIAVDLLPIDSIPGVVVIEGDATTDPVLERIDAALGGRPVDVVLSDMAPNISGVSAADAFRMEALVDLAIEQALRWLKPEGVLAIKLFQGPGFETCVANLRSAFTSVALRKPAASRDRSSETFAVARGVRTARR
jgi:23S rRNA (uridine2552-2'-O)-methyltransferase